MFQLHPIASIDLPELAPYRTMRRQSDHHRDRIFVAEGWKVIERMLNSHYGIVSVLTTEPWLKQLTPLLSARPENVPVYVAPADVLDQMTGYHLYQGVLAIGRVPEPPSLERILEAVPKPHLLVAVDEMANAENMGVLVRNCAAFGVHALITGETCTSPYLRRSVRNSMGTLFKLPVFESPRLIDTLLGLRRIGIRCIAAHPRADQVSLPDCNLQTDCCIVLGSEGHGLSKEVLAVCDVTAAIPMANEVDSLNVGNAGAVFLYEAFRQRRFQSPQSTVVSSRREDSAKPLQ